MLTSSLLVVAALWLAFIVLHVGLATRRVRGALVARLGERNFLALFSVVASVSFAIAIAAYAAHRGEGPAGLALGAVAWMRPILIAMTVLGIALMTAGSVTYPGSPYDLVDHAVRTPRGLERITRHPFFTGTALFGIAHALLATRLVGAIFAGGLALLAIIGSWHQDRKLLARLGPKYADYLAVTSGVPFAAIVTGRQRLVARELPFGPITAGVAVAFLLRAVHTSIFAYDGAFVIAAAVGGAALITWQSARHARRTRAVPTRAATQASAVHS